MSDRLSISFRNWGEIRMGSPYNTYSVTFTGRWTLDLRQFNLPVEPHAGWTNLHASSDDGRPEALVVWNLANNDPGFQVVVFDTQDRSISVSERYRDFPNTLCWEQDAFWIDNTIKIAL